ncbi:hypothetical protein H7X68_02715 [Candidatus Saccharibacteria bacterium]|nr:hypothetical protein [Candidatus Saccharibacteria bacterium]
MTELLKLSTDLKKCLERYPGIFQVSPEIGEVNIANHGANFDFESAIAEGALKHLGLKQQSGKNPITVLELDGYRTKIDTVVDELQASYAVLPNHEEATRAVVEATELLSQHDIMDGHNGGVEIVSDVPVDARKNTIIEHAPPSDFADTMHILSDMKSSLYRRRGDLDPGLASDLKRAVMAVDWNDLSLIESDRLVATMADFDGYREDLLGFDHEDTQNGIAINVLRTLVPVEVLTQMYQTEINGQPSAARILLNTNSLTQTKAYPNAIVLSRIYQDSGGVDKVAEGTDSAVDRLREFIDEIEFNILSIPEKPTDLTRSSIELHDRKVLYCTMDILDKIGLSDEVKREYFVAASSRLMTIDDETIYYNGHRVGDQLSIIKYNVEMVGSDVIERLHDKLGVVNIDNYMAGDLDSLNELLNASPEYIEHLQAGDVTIVFVDAYGDHNGAFGSLMDTYRKDSGRTIMFEISSPGDIYRRMALLKRLKVKPSTLVVGAHGRPGATYFGASFTLFSDKRVSRPNQGIGQIMLDQTSIDRLVGDEFMQPNRGVDSSAELVGRRQLILDSCSSDVEFKAGVPSTAAAISLRVGRTDTDVYGARSKMYARSLENDVGFYRWHPQGTVNQPNPESVASRTSLDPRPSMFGIKRGMRIKRELVSRIPVQKNRLERASV